MRSDYLAGITGCLHQQLLLQKPRMNLKPDRVVLQTKYDECLHASKCDLTQSKKKPQLARFSGFDLFCCGFAQSISLIVAQKSILLR